MMAGKGARHAVRLLHTQRQPLSRQYAHGRGFHQGHLRRGDLRRAGGTELGLDRRASFQPFGRQCLAARHPGPARRRHEEAAARARGDAFAGASPAASPRSGQRSTSSRAVASISPPAVVTTARSTSRSRPISRPQPSCSPRGWRSSGAPGPSPASGRTRAGSTNSRMSRFGPSRPRIRCAPTSPASRGRRWSWQPATTGT